VNDQDQARVNLVRACREQSDIFALLCAEDMSPERREFLEREHNSLVDEVDILARELVGYLDSDASERLPRYETVDADDHQDIEVYALHRPASDLKWWLSPLSYDDLVSRYYNSNNFDARDRRIIEVVVRRSCIIRPFNQVFDAPITEVMQ
jgi:hypothetical protein